MLIHPFVKLTGPLEAGLCLSQGNPQKKLKQYLKMVPSLAEIEDAFDWLWQGIPETNNHWFIALCTDCDLYFKKIYISPMVVRYDFLFTCRDTCVGLKPIIFSQWHTALEKLFPERISYYSDEDIERATSYAEASVAEEAKNCEEVSPLPKYPPNSSTKKKPTKKKSQFALTEDMAVMFKDLFLTKQPSVSELKQIAAKRSEWLESNAHAQDADFRRCTFQENENGISGAIIYINFDSTPTDDEIRENQRARIADGIYPVGVKASRDGKLIFGIVKDIDSYRHFNFLKHAGIDCV